jgi:D-lactate dehydrogenase (cytochrome)
MTLAAISHITASLDKGFQRRGRGQGAEGGLGQRAVRQALLRSRRAHFQFSGSQAQVTEQSAVLRELAQGHDFQWSTRPEERSWLWTPRHHAYFVCLQLRAGGRSCTTDACVPISEMADCIT